MQDRMLNTNSVLKQERFSSTATTKEDAQINRYKGMQDRMLYSNPAIKQERLSSQPNTNPRDNSVPHVSFQTNSLATEAPKLTIRVNPDSGHAGRHAQNSSTVENRASSIKHIPVYTDMDYVRSPGCPNKKNLTGKALVFHQVKESVRALTKVIIDADIGLTKASTKYIAELNYVRMESREVKPKLTEIQKVDQPKQEEDEGQGQPVSHI